MKLRNKKTGEIIILIDHIFDNYNSLAELNEEWEDYEEPKEHYFITEYGGVYSLNEYEGLNNVANVDEYKQIGNYFDTLEEAEKAVEKLKAVKRLKDKGFRFNGWRCTGSISFTFDNYYGDGQPKSASDDLDLLFSGGEE